MRIKSFSSHLMQCWYVYPSMRHKKCLQTHQHVSPPTFGVDILLILLYSIIYKGLRSFGLVLWMQSQCPVVNVITVYTLFMQVIIPKQAMVLGNLPVPWRPTIWMIVGQGPIALAVGAGGGCLDIFTLLYPFSLSPPLWETVR